MVVYEYIYMLAILVLLLFIVSPSCLGSKFLSLRLNFLGIFALAATVDLVCGALSSIIVVWSVQEVLDANQNLLDRN